MPKDASPELAAHVRGEATTLTTCWEIRRRDGVIIRLTELDVNLIIDGEVFRAMDGYSRTALENRASLEADTVDLQTVLSSNAIDRDDIRTGLYNSADLRIFAVNFLDLSQGIIRLKRGRLGEVFVGQDNSLRVQLRSLRAAMEQEILEKSSATCRARVGDARCRIPFDVEPVEPSTSYQVGEYVRAVVAPGTTSEIFGNRIFECIQAGTTNSSLGPFDPIVGNETTEGSAVFRSFQAWRRHGSVSAVVDRREFTIAVNEARAVDEWFTLGTITFESGGNQGRAAEVRSWVQTLGGGRLTVFLELPFTPGVGDVINITPGCDRTRTTCVEKFMLPGSTEFNNGNILNFRGEPDLPGQDAVLNYPDAN